LNIAIRTRRTSIFDFQKNVPAFVQFCQIIISSLKRWLYAPRIVIRYPCRCKLTIGHAESTGNLHTMLKDIKGAFLMPQCFSFLCETVFDLR